MAHLKDQEFLKQLVYISWHDSCMQSWGRRLEPGLSGWIWSRLPLPSSCHPHTAVTRACNTYCGCGFGLGGGTVNHSTSPLCLLPSVSLSVRVSLLLSVSPSQRHRRTRIKSAGTAWSEIPSRTADIAVHAPHPYRPSLDGSRVHAQTYIRVRPDPRAHVIKALFIWGNWKEAFLISSLALSPFCRGGERACTFALQILTYRKTRYRKKKNTEWRCTITSN